MSDSAAAPASPGGPPSPGETVNTTIIPPAPEEKKISSFASLKARLLLQNPDLALARPQLGRGLFSSSDFIDFDGEDDKPKKKKLSKKEKGIEALMERFARHVTAPPQPEDDKSEKKKGRHKIRITQTSADSQGLVHSVTDEIDYVETKEDDDEDVISKLNQGGGNTPGRRETAPGEKLFRLKQALKQSIRAKKVRGYEEKMKLCDEEKKDYEEDVEEEEEVIEDDEDDEDEEEEEEDPEEDDELLDDVDQEEDILEEGGKKRRRRLIYVDDEAEDEDEGRMEDSDCEIEDEGVEDGVDADVEDELLDFEEKNDQTSEIVDEDGKKNCEEDKSEQITSPIKTLISEAFQPLKQSDFNLAALCSGKFASQLPDLDDEEEDCPGFEIPDDEEELLSPSHQSCSEPVPISQDLFSQESEAVSSVPTLNTKPVDRTCAAFSQDLFSEESEKVCTPKAETLPTPKAVPLSVAADNDTPKTVKAVVKSRALRFEEAKKESTPKGSRILSDSEEENEDGHGSLTPRRPKKKRLRLKFSDDEDSDVEKENINENEEDPISEGDEEGEAASEAGEADVHMDSEDDEEAALERELASRKKKSTLLTSKGKINPKFLDLEAELSDNSDFNASDDEDEKGLDFYEKDEADNDDVDEEEVKKHLERAHLKYLLDADDKAIRDLQNEYLERGDLEDGKQRERKFRWGDVDGAWADDNAGMGDSDPEQVHEEEDAEEVKRKLEEIEKRKWLHENSQIIDEDSTLLAKPKFLKLGKSTMKKIESFVEGSSNIGFVAETSNSVPDFPLASLIKAKIKMHPKDQTDTVKKGTDQFESPEVLKVKRGSFLSRGSPSLTRLAEITKVNDASNQNTSNVKSNSRKFVFEVVEKKEEKPMGTKRSNSQVPATKRPKMDRSFSSLDEGSKDASVFRWF